MASHSSTLAWKIPWTEEPGALQSMGSLRVGLDWTTSLSFSTFMHWRRKWQPTPVFLLGESQGRGSLVGCRLWGRRVGHDWSNLAVAVKCNYLNFNFLKEIKETFSSLVTLAYFTCTIATVVVEYNIGLFRMNTAVIIESSVGYR